jgi:type VI protein secretion system component VasF
MNASDALINNLVFAAVRDKALAEHLALVQSAGNEVVVMADEELARQTMALNQTIARLLLPSAKPMEQRLAELNAQVVEWIKQFKRSLDALKTQHEEAQSFKASTQTVAQLKR